MTERYIDSVCSAIAECFGEDYHIYTDKVPQEFLTPCFFVSLDSSDRQERLGGRAILRCAVTVKYFPGNSIEPEGECRWVMDRLQYALKFIETDGVTIPGFSLSGSIGKSKLSFSVVYDIFVTSEEETEKMEVLTIQKNIGNKILEKEGM